MQVCVCVRARPSVDVATFLAECKRKKQFKFIGYIGN